MTPVEYYVKNKKVYHYEPTPAELKEIKAQRNKVRKARYVHELVMQAQYEYEHQGGYCPKCFLLRPITGACPTCN